MGRAGVPDDEYAGRVRRLQEEAARRGLDGVIAWSKNGGPVDSCADVFYLSGWYSPFPRIQDQRPVWSARSYSAIYAPSSGDPVLFVDVPDYRAEVVSIADVRTGINLPETVAKGIAELGHDRGEIGISGSETMLWASYRHLVEELPGARFTPADDILGGQRMIKSEAEIAALRHAADVGSEVVSTMLRTAQEPGKTEAEAVGAGWKVGIELGAAPWDSAVASGPNSDYYAYHSLPSWSRRTLERGDIFHVDTYGSVDGYLYDISRSCVCGQSATDEQKEVLEGAIGCVDAMIDMIKPGVLASEIFQVGNSYLSDNGLDGSDADGEVTVALVSSFPCHGHGYGLTLETPWLRPGESMPIQENMALAVEAMAGRVGVGAAKFEQDLVVTAAGTDLLVEAPKVWWS
jgi:Xaa-Pro aminopeptidase